MFPRARRTNYHRPTASGRAFQINGDFHVYGSGAESDTIRACRKALFLTDPQIHRDTLRNQTWRASGTCEWISANNVYITWLRSKSSKLLWVHGPPGIGKTVLSIYLTEELELLGCGPEGSCLLYYFCAHSDDKRNTEVAVLRGLMFQLIERWPDLIKLLLRDFELYKDNQTLFSVENREVLWKNFQVMLSKIDVATVYCVIDGLDEIKSNSMDWLPKKLRELSSTMESKTMTKIIVTSRDFPDSIRSTLEDVEQVIMNPEVNSKVRIDLENFISETVGCLARSRGYNDDLKKTVYRGLVEGADGTFLWVSYVAEALKETVASETEAVLRRQPRGLTGIYERMLLEVDDDRRDDVVEILHWLVGTFRPLTLTELSIATSTLPTRTLSRNAVIRERIGFAGSLLKVVESNQPYVQFFHSTAKTFLLELHTTSNPHLQIFQINKSEINLKIAQRCFQYVQSGAFSDGPIDLLDSDPASPSSARRRQYPLLDYAAKSWPEHARRASPAVVSMFERWPSFCTPSSIIRDCWLKTYWSYTVQDWDCPDNFGMIDLAAFFGITPVLSKLLAERRLQSFDILSNAVHKKPNHGMTSLHWACRNGHDEAVKLLLVGASMNTRGYGMTPLTWAVRNGHDSVVKTLLEEGASSEMKDYGMTSLNWAAWEGKSEVARLLMFHDAEVNAATTHGNNQQSWLVNTKSSTGEFPWATAIEAADIIKAVELDQEIQNTRESTVLDFLETALELFIVSFRHLEGTVWLFVGRRLDNRIWLSNRTGQIRGEPVCLAAVTKVGKLRILYDLLGDYRYVVSSFAKAYESYPQSFRSFGATSLVLWLYAYWQSLIRYTVMSLVWMIGFGETFTFFCYIMNYGFLREYTPTLVNVLYLTTHWAQLKRGFLGLLIQCSSFVIMVILLICVGIGHDWIQINFDYILVVLSATKTAVFALLARRSKISDGYTSLYLAASRGHENVVRLLIENGANTAIIDSTGRTAQQMAMQNGYMAVVHTFLDKEAEGAGRYFPGSSSLQLAASLGNLDLVKDLFKRGVDVDRCSENGWTALHPAAYYGLLDVVRFLCEEAKTNAICVKDRSGCTPLHLASRQGKTGICVYLHGKGAEVDSQDVENYTPLHMACCGAYLDTVKALLDIGSDIEARAQLQRRALHLAAMQDSSAVVALLIEKKAEINSVDSNRRTPLFFASFCGQLGTVACLLENGADPNIIDNSGISSLHCAAFGGRLEVARRLIAGGAVTRHDAYSISPLVCAIRNDKEDILEYLLEVGSYPNEVDSFGRTPFDYASEKPSLFQAMLRFDKRHPTPEQVQVDTLRRTVKRLARKVLDAPPENRQFEDLAFALLQLRRFEESKTVYSWLGFDVGSQPPSCDACSSNDTGLEAHTCQVCFQLYLCNICMERYRDGVIKPCGCQKHEYLAFRRQKWGGMDSQERNKMNEDIAGWLLRILENFHGSN